MTLTALILLDRFYSQGLSQRLMYTTLGLLFVNISIGGTLTPYAAPPVLMVASKWGWNLSYMLAHFGWKAAAAILLATSWVTARSHQELSRLSLTPRTRKTGERIPFWVTAVHLGFLALVVIAAHHLVIFVGIFLLFLGLVKVTQEYQSELKIREGLLVSAFLGGLVVLGGPQRWWLEPLLAQLKEFPLFLGTTALTAITDNAALTYLGAQVPGLSEGAKYALVAGAVTGGGLTVIANAPNPAGYGILNDSFGKDGIDPLQLFLAALVPTGIAAACFWLL
jgi:Na+/H+ antiporter NhaD/arsenite permease-like protein